MEKTYEVLCLKTHGYYTKGKKYKCKYEKISNEYYQIFYNKDDYCYADKGTSYCDLNNFMKTDEITTVRFYKRIKLISMINKTFKLNINEYVKGFKCYNFSKLSPEICSEVYTKILPLIQGTYSSEFYVYHQDKFHYILSSIIKIDKMREQIDVNTRLEKYEKLIKDVIESIKIQNELVAKEQATNMTPMIQQYIDKEDSLLDSWEDCLNAVWGKDNKNQ